MKISSTVSLAAAVVAVIALSGMLLSGLPSHSEQDGARPSKCGAHRVERRLDARSGMMITRYGCTNAAQGRWRDVARLMFAPAAR